MHNLTQEQVIKRLTELLGEDITDEFEKQLKEAGEHGNSIFVVENSKGEEIKVSVDWEKEADVLSYSLLLN